MTDSSRALEMPATTSRQSISLVVPAYNEQATIGQAIAEAVAALSSITDDFEVLIVDDGSTDATAVIVGAVADEDSRVRLIQQPRNCGYGAALRRGFGAATKELVGFTDADCQFDLREIDRLVLLARDYDIVCGYRIDRKDPWLRRLYSAGYNVLVRALLGTRVRDCDCALKLFHRKVLAKLPITTDGFLVNGEMLASAHQQGLSVVEVGVSHRPRCGGQSKVSIAHIPVVLAALLRFWWTRVQFAGRETESFSQQRTEWRRQHRLAAVASLLAAGSLFGSINLGYSFIEPDESRYAQISLEMLQSGDWLVPRLHGEPYLDKPPLLYWAIAASYSAVGVSESAARLPGVVAMVLTVLATYLLGRKLVGDLAAWAGGIVLLMCGGFIAAGHYIMMDGLLTLFTTMALLAACCALFTTRHRLYWWGLAGLACGLGILTKGPVAPVLCAPPILGIAWLTNCQRSLRLNGILAIVVPMLAVACPWFLLVAEEQREFAWYFFWKHNVVRYVDSFHHVQPWWFYLPMLALGMMPATLLMPGLGVYMAQRGQESCRRRTRELGALLLAAAWIIAFFTMSSCKLVTYVLPAYPLLALACGKMLSDTLCATSIGEHVLKNLTRRTVWFATGVINWVIICGFVFIVILGPWTSAYLGLFTLVSAVVLALLYTNRFNSQKRLLAAALGSYGMAAIFGFGFVVPEFADWRSVARSAAEVQADLGGDVPVVFFGRRSYAATFEIPAGVVEFTPEEFEAFEEYMGGHPRAVVVADRHDFPGLLAECADTIVFEGPRARSRVYVATRRTNMARHAVPIGSIRK